MLHFPDALVGGADLHLLEPNTHGVPADSPPPQQCGRCRLLFEGDPTLHPAARPDWWLCPPCRAILLGRHPHPNDVAHRRHVGQTPEHGPRLATSASPRWALTVTARQPSMEYLKEGAP